MKSKDTLVSLLFLKPISKYITVLEQKNLSKSGVIWLVTLVLLVTVIGCKKPGPNKEEKGLPSRIKFNSEWITLGDDKGELDKENGKAAVESVEFSSDGKFIISAGRSGNLRVWDSGSGKIVFDHLCDNELKTAVFSPDGKFILAGGESKKIMIWKVSDWTLYKTIDFEASVEGIRFSHNQKMFAAGDEAGMISLFDYDSFEKINTIHHGEDSIHTFIPRSDVNSVDFSSDDKYLVSGSINGQIKIWYVPELELIKTLNSGSSSIKSVRVNQGNHCIASASTSSSWGNENMVKIWDFKSGEMLHSLSFPGGMESVEFSPDGKYLYCGGGARNDSIGKSPKGYIYVYYIPDDFLTEPIKQVHKEDVFRSEYLNIDREGRALVSAHEDGTVRLWSILYKR